MTLAFDLPRTESAWIAAWDPRWKLAAIMFGVVAVALLRSAILAWIAWISIAVLLTVAGFSWKWWLQRIAAPLAMFCFFFLWLALFPRPEETPARYVGLNWSPHGCRLFAGLLAKMLAIVSLVWMLLGSTPLADVFHAAQRLKVPAPMIHLALLTMRYVFLLGEEWSRLRTALRVRGFRNRADWHSYRTIGQVAGTLIVRSHERAERVGQAMRARGFHGEFPSLRDFQTARRDIAHFALIVGAFIVLVAIDLWSRPW